MGEKAQRQMTADEFLAWHEGRDDKWELVGGIPVKMMVGATHAHDRIVVNTIAQLVLQLRGSGCRPTTDDIAVVTRSGTNVRRPDITIDCGKFESKGLRADDPRMVIEVLSKSTRAFDMAQKLEEYKSVDPLSYVLYLDTEAPRAKLYSRAPDGWHNQDFIGLENTIDLPDIGATLALEDLYDGLSWPGEEDE